MNAPHLLILYPHIIAVLYLTNFDTFTKSSYADGKIDLNAFNPIPNVTTAVVKIENVFLLGFVKTAAKIIIRTNSIKKIFNSATAAIIKDDDEIAMTFFKLVFS